MKNTYKSKKTVSADKIARLADEGKDVSRFFTNSGRVMRPIQKERAGKQLGNQSPKAQQS